MKKRFSTIFGVGLALVLAIALAMPMAVQAKTLDWGEEDLPVVRGITETFSGKTVTPLYDILGLSAANDGKTIYAVVKAEAGHKYEGQQVVFRSTNGGQSWSKKSPKTPTGSVISHVAVSPDDPTVVVAAGLVDNTPYAWISTDKGETWSASNISGELSVDITSIAISEERDDIRWVAVGSDATAIPFTLQQEDGVAEWSADEAHSGSSSVSISSGTGGADSYGKVEIPVDIALGSITSLSFKYYLSSTTQIASLFNTWPVYMEEGLTYTDYNGYLSPYIVLEITDGTSTHWLISQPFGRDPDSAWTPGWESWDLADNAPEYPAASEMNPTEALWHDEFFTDNTGTGGSGAYPTGWESLSFFQEGTYTDYTVTKVKVAIGEWDITTDQSAYVDDITINEDTYEFEAGKCLAVAKAEAFAGWVDASDWAGFSDASATDGVLAVAFSPWFNNDNTLLVVTAGTSTTWLQAAEVGATWAACKFNASTTPFADYPVEIGDKIVATAASISLPDTYYGYDAAERIAYIGTTDGVYRMDDDLSEKIKSGSLPSVAYNSEENQLLVGYSTSGRVDMSSNPDSGSPTFTRPASMKSPSGESVSGVAWIGTTMMASTKDIGTETEDDESAISVSTDARAWSQLSLIDTDLDNITDVAVSEDGSRIYVASQSSDGDYYSIWRYAGRWERVLCDDYASGQTGVIVRLAPEKPEVVFVGLVNTKEIRRSTDSGDTWKQSRADIEVQDIAVKDDKIVFVVKGNGRVSTSKDGGRTFDDYVKSNVNARHMIVAPNGDVLIAGEDVVKSPTKISVALSTDDGATWSRMPITTGLSEYEPIKDEPNPLLVAADTDYATNNLIYVAHTDGDEANILRWEVGGDYEVWQDIGTAYYKKVTVAGKKVAHMTEEQVISGLVCQEGMLYIAYYSDNVSGFISTNCPTVKRTSVTWGGGPGTDTELDALFTLTPQALKLSSGSVKLWAIDTRIEATDTDRLYSYTDILAKVEEPTITGPADKYKGTVDAALQKINPVRFTWEEVTPDVSYQLRIATNAKVSQNYVTYSTGTSEFITIRDGPSKAADMTFAFAAGETYWWKVRVSAPTVGPWSETRSFTIEEAEVPVAEAPVVTVTPPEVTVQAPPPAPAPQVTVEAPPPAAPAPVIPDYLLWTIIGIGAVLVIALIVLIVRTRRVV